MSVPSVTASHVSVATPSAHASDTFRGALGVPLPTNTDPFTLGDSPASLWQYTVISFIPTNGKAIVSVTVAPAAAEPFLTSDVFVPYLTV